MTSLGSFTVTADPTEVEAFRTATGLAPGKAVPTTFPMRWLAAREVRDALLVMAPEVDFVPVHESQTFDYLDALCVGEHYVLRLDARRETSPERLVLSGTITGMGGDLLVRVETILRLFSVNAAAA